MKNEIVKLDVSELQGIEPSKANQIKATFEPMVDMLSKFEESYNKIILDSQKEINSEVISRAKRLRIDIGKVRIETEKVRKKQKEEYLLAGKAIDGVSNILKWAVEKKENKLKEIENYFKIQEEKRLEKLQLERTEKLSKYVDDAHERKLSEMDEDVWNAYFQTKKKEHEDKVAAEKKVEKERKEKEKLDKLERKRLDEALPYKQFWTTEKYAFREMSETNFKSIMSDLKKQKVDFDKQQESIRKENERIKKQQEEERKKAETERKAIEEREKEERKKREQLEAKLRAKEEAEKAIKEEEEKKRQAELDKDDNDKVNDLINDFEFLKFKYSFKSDKNKRMYNDVGLLIDKIVNYIQVKYKNQ